jgi:NAD-reducing hydrogenase small subunit
MTRPRLATCWLDGCSGCHMSLLDADARLVELLRGADLVFGPLVDAQEVPDGIDVALVEGAVGNQDDLRLARLIRQKSRTVVALGDCAVTSNVPGLRNGIPPRRLLERIYVDGVAANPGVPSDGVPPLLRQALPLHDVIPVDLHVPGCPPKPDLMLFVLRELLEGRRPNLGAKARFG